MNNQDIFRFTDSRQERIYQGLRFIGPGPAAFYKDACHLMTMNSKLETITHLVSHCLREVESSLRPVLDPIKDKSAIKSESDKKSETCPNDEVKETHRDDVRAILRGIGVSEDDPIGRYWLSVIGSSNNASLNKRAHRNDISDPRPFSDEFNKFWNEMNEVLDVVVYHFKIRYFDWIDIIDSVLKEKDITLAVKNFRKMPRNFVILRYFFDNLSSAAWIKYLDIEGLFSTPPSSILDHEQGTISFSIWPASMYLARMAKEAPEEVIPIIKKLPDTENWHIHEDIINAALSLESAYAIQLLPTIKKYIGSRYQRRFPSKVAQLIIRLVQQEKVDDAFDLAQELLTIVPNPRDTDDLSIVEREWRSIAPRSRFNDDWQYEQILEQCVPSLFEVDAYRTINMICGILKICVELSRDSGEFPNDFSYRWRKTIEYRRGNRNKVDIRDSLISSIRDLSEKLAEVNSQVVPNVVKILESYSWYIFQRIALHLVRLFPEYSLDIIRAYLLDSNIRTNTHFSHEYKLLAQAHFKNLLHDEQEQILQWIDQATEIREIVRDTDQTDDEKNQSIQDWQRHQVGPFQQDLSTTWKEKLNITPESNFRFDEEAEDEDGLVSYEPHIISPKSVDELVAMDKDTLIAFLQNWEPAPASLRVSESIVPSLQRAARSKPYQFSQYGETLASVRLSYITVILQGIFEAIKEKDVDIDWPTLLDLCSRVVLRTIRDDKSIEDDSSQLRRTIIHVTGLGFEKKYIPYSLYLSVWNIIKLLVEDPDPPFQELQRHSQYPQDLNQESWNTIRGEALYAIIHYLIWIDQQDGNGVRQDIEHIREIQLTLERHLDPSYDKALAIRHVYGWAIPWLYKFDPLWTQRNIQNILPTDPQLQVLRDAAWESYVTRQSSSRLMFEFLERDYRIAVERIGQPSTIQPQFSDRDEGLGHHLIDLYIYGVIELAQPDCLLILFYNRASAPLRQTMMQSLAWRLEGSEDKISPTIKDRLQAFWEFRMHDMLKKEDSKDAIDECRCFGSWFSSKQFDNLWALNQLKEVLRFAQGIEFEYKVVEFLAELAEMYPAEALECLRLLMEHEEKTWRMSMWDDQVQAILRAALLHKDPQTQDQAKKVINLLGSQGHNQFRSLLSQ